MTTENPPQGLLDPPPAHVGRAPVGDETGSNLSQIVVAVISLSIAFLFIFIIFIVIFLRRCKKNRKVYIPVTPNFNMMPNSTEGHPKHEMSQRHANMSGIFESLVAVGRETDDEYGDEMSEIQSTNSHCEGINLEPSLKYKGNSASPSHVPSRNKESKHSRSLPSLKHLSAHEEALSYLALGHSQGPSVSPKQIKPQTSSGVFETNENGFIRSRSFNERIAFGLNISRNSLSNRNRINVNALNRCMTTATTENDVKLKLKCKESIKGRKQKNVRGSFIKSMRISNLVEFMPTSFNIRKRLSNSVSRYRKSLENYRTPPATSSATETCPVYKSTSFCTSKINPNDVAKTMAHPHSHFEQLHSRISPSLDSSKIVENPFIMNFLEDINSSNKFVTSRNNDVRRSKSCVILSIPTRTLSMNRVALRSGNAISFDQLEEYSKKFMG